MARPPSTAVLVGAMGVPLLVCAVLAQLRSAVAAPDAALVLVLVIVVAAVAGSRSAGLLAAVSSAAWFDFFLSPPYHRFTLANHDDVETTVLLIVVGAAVTEIALWGRRQQAGSSEREGYLSGVVAAAGLVATGPAGSRSVVDFVCRQVVDVLGADRCEYAAGPSGGAHPQLGRDGRVIRGSHVVDVRRSGLPSDDVLEVPIGWRGASVGRLVVTTASRTVWPTEEQLRVVATLADQVAATVVGPAER